MNLNITLIQNFIYWQDVDANLNHFSEIASGITGATDLLILPEMFSTGFSVQQPLPSEDMQGRSVEWMTLLAAKMNCVVTGSLIITDHWKYYNRLVWMRPDGTFDYYDKRHLFRMSDEEQYFTAGGKKLIVDLKGWKVCPLICYDLRFPVWSRNRNDYDLLVYVANWPDSRIDVWNTLLKARAIENQCYVAGVNRTGKDNSGTEFPGYSAVIDFKGNITGTLDKNQEGIIQVNISSDTLMTFREKFPVYLDADRFNIL